MDYTQEEAAKMYHALLADGVDNWEGYFVKGGHAAQVSDEIKLERGVEKMLGILDPVFELIEENIEVDYPIGRDGGPRSEVTEKGRQEVAKFILKYFNHK